MLGPFLNELKTAAKWIGRITHSGIKRLVGTRQIEARLFTVERHTAAMTEVIHMLMADAMGTWENPDRERAQRHIADFQELNVGLAKVKPSGNPVSETELATLREYVKRAEAGGTFTPDEATHYNELANKVAHDYGREDWVTQLLKVGLIIGGIAAIASALSSPKEE